MARDTHPWDLDAGVRGCFLYSIPMMYFWKIMSGVTIACKAMIEG